MCHSTVKAHEFSYILRIKQGYNIRYLAISLQGFRTGDSEMKS